MSAPDPSATATATATVPAEEQEPRWLEPVSAVLLGLAAVLTALAAYLSAAQAGDEDQARAESIRHNAEANAFTNAATQIRAADQAMFAAWADAAYNDDDEFSAYLMTLMRPELNTAIETWSDTGDDVDTPFELDLYVIEEAEKAEESFQAMAAADKRAQIAADRGDTYDKSTVFLALSLFFGGVASLFSRRRYSGTMLAIGAVTLVIGAFQLVVA